jgi:hypothetical protein
MTWAYLQLVLPLTKAACSVFTDNGFPWKWAALIIGSARFAPANNDHAGVRQSRQSGCFRGRETVVRNAGQLWRHVCRGGRSEGGAETDWHRVWATPVQFSVPSGSKNDPNWFPAGLSRRSLEWCHRAVLDLFGALEHDLRVCTHNDGVPCSNQGVATTNSRGCLGSPFLVWAPCPPRAHAVPIRCPGHVR